jgi:hypothetical protein
MKRKTTIKSTTGGSPKRPTERRPRGRPRDPATSDLSRALIERQDALAERRARDLAELRARYLDESVAVAERLEARQMLVDRMLRVPAAVAPAIAELENPDDVHRLLESAIREALEDIANAYARSAESAGCAAAPPVSVRHRSRSLAVARARAADAQTALMAFRERLRSSGSPGADG